MNAVHDSATFMLHNTHIHWTDVQCTYVLVAQIYQGVCQGVKLQILQSHRQVASALTNIAKVYAGQEQCPGKAWIKS